MFQRVWKALAGEPDSPPREGRRRGPSCAQCRALLAPRARRCTRCGARVSPELIESSAGSSRPPLSADATTARVLSVPVEQPGDSLELRILTAALPGPDGVPSIQVLPSRGTIVGEIKVRGERIFGDEAVQAVARLVKGGDLQPTNGGFVLSPSGRQRAKSSSR